MVLKDTSLSNYDEKHAAKPGPLRMKWYWSARTMWVSGTNTPFLPVSCSQHSDKMKISMNSSVGVEKPRRILAEYFNCVWVLRLYSLW